MVWFSAAFACGLLTFACVVFGVTLRFVLIVASVVFPYGGCDFCGAGLLFQFISGWFVSCCWFVCSSLDV